MENNFKTTIVGFPFQTRTNSWSLTLFSKKYFIILLSLLLAVNYSMAQSSIEEVNTLALKCSKGNTSSCNMLNYIAKNDENVKVRTVAILKIVNRRYIDESAVKKITDQQILADIAKNIYSFIGGIKAVKKIKSQELLLDIAKNGKYSHPRYVALSRLDANIYYDQILDIVKTEGKKRNYQLAGIAALRIIPEDKTIANRFRKFDIKIIVTPYIQKYNLGLWRIIDVDIRIKTNEFKKNFYYRGQRGSYMEKQLNISKIHAKVINMVEICTLILSHLKESEINEIYQSSEISFLREAARRMLQK